MIGLMQIVPVAGCRLFGKMVKKEIELTRKNRGTFFRSAAKQRDHATWANFAPTYYAVVQDPSLATTA